MTIRDPQAQKISVIRKKDKIVVLDSRTGAQHRFNIPIVGKTHVINGQHDSIVVDIENLSYVVKPREEVTYLGQHRCIHQGDFLPQRFPPEEGLGDYVVNLLDSIGITKERFYSLVHQGKKEIGECSGCGQRQKFFNWIGNKLGLPEGRGEVLKKILVTLDIKNIPVATCELFDKCLPNLAIIDNNMRTAIEDTGHHLCYRCNKKELVPSHSEPIDFLNKHPE